jgi:hypothetical protein
MMPTAVRLAILCLVGSLPPSPIAAQTCDGVELTTGTERRCFRPGSAERFKDCPDCPEMVVVPAGTFMMGSPPNEPEREAEREVQVRVTIAKPFSIAPLPSRKASSQPSLPRPTMQWIRAATSGPGRPGTSDRTAHGALLGFPRMTAIP